MSAALQTSNSRQICCQLFDFEVQNYTSQNKSDKQETLRFCCHVIFTHILSLCMYLKLDFLPNEVAAYLMYVRASCESTTGKLLT